MFIFLFSHTSFCGELIHENWCIIPSFSRKEDNTWLKCSFPLYDLMALILTPNYVLTILGKTKNTKLSFDLFFMRHNQFPSTIIDKGHKPHCSKKTWDSRGIQLSVWINKKRNIDFVFLKGNRTWWYLANWQTSQWKPLTSDLLNNIGNIFFSKEEDGCPKRSWCVWSNRLIHWS